MVTAGEVDPFTSWRHRSKFPELAAVVAAALEAAGYQGVADHERRAAHPANPGWSRRRRGEGSVRRLARTRIRPARPWPRSAC